MQSKPIRTYSRKRKRTSSTPEIRTTPPSKSNTRRADAATTLPSPPNSSSPLLPPPSPLQPLSPNIAASHLHTPADPTNSETPPSHPPPKHNPKSSNSNGNSKPPAIHHKRKKLTQLTLDLGGNPRRRCPSCGMEYVPSNAEDARLHRAFHAAGVGGVDVPAGVSERWRVVGRCGRRGADVTTTTAAKKGAGAGEGVDVVVEVGRHDALGVRNLARRVLGVVEGELGGVGAGAGGGLRRAGDAEWWDGHKAYLYVRESKCVGLCLAERIDEAFSVLPCARLGLASSSSISTAEKPVSAVLGISRVWVSREFRGNGVARELLETTRREFLYGVKLGKHDMAFSQPTESGGKLARAWFGEDDGWKVYDLSRGSHGNAIPQTRATKYQDK